jgi:hypothetical protein
MKSKFNILFTFNWNKDTWNLALIFMLMSVENQNSLNICLKLTSVIRIIKALKIIISNDLNKFNYLVKST